MLNGRVLITGGTGTLGRAIVQRAQCGNWPVEFTILSRDEVKQSIMKRDFPDCRYMLGDVSDRNWLKTRFRNHDTVIHAAAYKQVPSAEFNAREAVRANIMGSVAVAEAAVTAGVRWVVGISTDKACAPVNAYGATKMLMEKVFQEAVLWDETMFTLCRYGNVVGSRGSVVPFFKAQVAKAHHNNEHGVMTVTDSRMTRFWLSIDDAVNLVEHAATLTVKGGIVVPKAPASRVYDIAKAVCGGCDIVDIGIRPGEKIHETLLHSGESQHTQEYDNYFIVLPAQSVPTRALPLDYEYTSAFPSHVLDANELAKMVRDAHD